MRILNRDLPENVNLLTLEPRSDGDFLLRLEHSTFEDYSDEIEIESLSTTVDLKVHIPSYYMHDKMVKIAAHLLIQMFI